MTLCTEVAAIAGQIIKSYQNKWPDFQKAFLVLVLFACCFVCLFSFVCLLLGFFVWLVVVGLCVVGCFGGVLVILCMSETAHVEGRVEGKWKGQRGAR